MSTSELTKIESISQVFIKRNVGVYGKELPLHVAQKINSLRAVFGESYPDPVRVVSLEFDVDDIAKDLENPKWRKTSIELCGGTYVYPLIPAHRTCAEVWARLLQPCRANWRD